MKDTAAAPGWLAKAALSLQRLWWQPRLRGWARCLWPLSLVFAGVSAWRRWRHTRGMPSRQALGLPCPIVVVGNLIVGGAGKTPTTIALVQLLRAQGWRPGVVSRGYGRRSIALCDVQADTPASQSGDEPLLIHLRTGAPVCVHSQRLEAARQLLARHPEVNLIVADDGLQHLRLPRDVQVIVFDARGIGNGCLLPAGPLRQGLAAQVPARSLVIYNASAPSTPWPGHIAQRGLSGLCAWADWRQGARPQTSTLEALRARSRQRPLLAAAGLAEPERFFSMLESLGLNIERLPLPDHADLSTPPWPAGTPDVILTEKDAVKLHAEGLGAQRIWVAPLDFALPDAAAAQLAHWLAPWHPAPHQRV